MVTLLRNAITGSDLSLNELAKKAGVDHSQLSRFVRGERSLSLEVAAKVLDALGIRVVPPSGQEDEPAEPAERPRGKRK